MYILFSRVHTRTNSRFVRCIEIRFIGSPSRAEQGGYRSRFFFGNGDRLQALMDAVAYLRDCQVLGITPGNDTERLVEETYLQYYYPNEAEGV